VQRKRPFRPLLFSWVGASEVLARFGVNTFGRVGARMARLGHGMAAISEAQAYNAQPSLRTVPVPIPEGDEDRKDHFVTRNGVTFAGSHLIVDLWEAEGLDCKDRIEAALLDAVEAANATLLHIHLHVFEPGGGISGVAVLAESHISVHTWPEHGYAAFDIFMCGQAEPRKALSVLKRAFDPKRVVIGEHKRGVL
jgi:S-adenosylmethionine decarboxylase